jgi:O-antigen ligase
MTRLLTAPFVGALAGALEEGAVFVILTIIDTRDKHYVFMNGDEMISVAAAIGIILGGIVGGVIGLVVALGNAGGRSGWFLGSLIGLAFAILIMIRTGSEENWTIVALTVIPAGASIGLLSAVVTAPRKGPPPTADVDRSRRILS